VGKVFIRPWKYKFLSLCVYVIDQILSILNKTGILLIDPLVFPAIEFVIITIFIYTLLTLREHIKKEALK
jgi:hypothetical protein